jgi:hypothetical protein
MSEDPSDRLAASRARDAAILADLDRREAGRWRRDYVVGAVVLTLLLAGSLIELVGLTAGVVAAVVWTLLWTAVVPAVVRRIALRPDRRA